MRGNIDKLMKITILRRFVLLTIILLFLLQFLKIKVLIGGLSGSVVMWHINLLDIFAYLETLIASREFSEQAFFSVITLMGLYLIFGRAFCGWVCPMDFLFEIINKAKKWQKMKLKISTHIGFAVVIVFLIFSYFTEIPFFTNYLSHLTNFFRMLTSGVFLSLNLPVDKTVFYFSGGIIFLLLGLEYFFPRLWCRVLCPLGKIYGIFNKMSLLRLKLQIGQCWRCNLCEQICYMDVRISSANKPLLRDSNCIYCGKCIEGCSEKAKIIKMNFGWRQ